MRAKSVISTNNAKPVIPANASEAFRTVLSKQTREPGAYYT